MSTTVIDQISLYSTATGEELTGLPAVHRRGYGQPVQQRQISAGRIWPAPNKARCSVSSMSRCGITCPVLPVTEPDASAPEIAGRYRFHDLLTGEEKELYDVGTDDATLAIYALDGTVRVFDRQTGVLLTDTAIDPVENQVRAHVYAENGWVWVAQDDNDSYDEHGHPDLWAGRHPQNAGSPHAGRNLHPLLSPVFHSRWTLFLRLLQRPRQQLAV